MPLLVFTDTLGLGDLNQDTETIIQELISDLQTEATGARVSIITVEINDFATDTLRKISQKLRQ